MPKSLGLKAEFTWPLIWEAIDIPSTHILTKERGGKNPEFFCSVMIGYFIQNKSTNKKKNSKGLEKGIKCGEQQKITNEVARQTETKLHCFYVFVCNSRGRAKAHHVFCLRHRKSKETAKTKPEWLSDSLKSNKASSSITDSKAFFFFSFFFLPFFWIIWVFDLVQMNLL